MGTDEDRADDARTERLREADAQRWDEEGDLDPPKCGGCAGAGCELCDNTGAQ